MGGDSALGTVRNRPPLADAADAAATAAAGMPVPVDGRGRIGRDYGPGIPVTRIASWSTFGDEGGGTIFGDVGDDDQADAARRKGGRGEEGASEIRVPGGGLRRQGLKDASGAGTPGQGANEGEESCRSADWAT